MDKNKVNGKPDIICNIDDINFLTLPPGASFVVGVETNADGIERLKSALKEAKRSPAEQEKHDIQVMKEVRECDGKDISEKIDNYIKKKDEQAALVEKELSAMRKGMTFETITPYKLRYR